MRGRAVEFTVGKFGLKLCRQREGEWLSVIGKTHKIRASRDDNGYWVYTFNVPTPNVEQLNDEAIRERAANVIRQLSPLGFLNQKYPNAIGGNLGQLEQFIADFVTAGWPETSSVAANTLANGIRRIILGECEIVECERKESPVIQAIEGATGVPRNWVPLLRPTAPVDESKAMESAKAVETAQVVKGSPELAEVRQGREVYQLDIAYETLDLLRREKHGLVMQLEGDWHATIGVVDDARIVRVKVMPGTREERLAHFEQETKSFEQLIAEVGNWKPPLEPGVKASEFGLAPQVGKALLDGLKRLRKRLQAVDSRPASTKLEFAIEGIVSLINQAELPGFPVPDGTFDAEAATLDDGPDAETPVWAAIDELAPHVSRAGDGPWYRLKKAVDVAEARALRPWRLPTLEECANDPEATRVWNAVHKPALEWHRTADGLPPITGEGDSRSESEHRFLWVKYDDDSWPVTSKAHVIHSRCRIGGRTPVLWAEIEPAPPLPPKLSNAELHNLYE